MIGRSGEKVHHAAQCIDAMECRSRAFKRLDRIDGVHRQRQIEIVVRGLRIVDAEAVEQHQRLLETAAAHDDVGLPAARAALLKKNRGVFAQKILRRLGGQRLPLHGENIDRTLGLGKRYRRGRPQNDHSLCGRLHGRFRRRCGILRKGRGQHNSQQQRWGVRDPSKSTHQVSHHRRRARPLQR